MRKLIWLFLNLSATLCAVLGLIYENTYALNLLMFLIWAMFPFHLISLTLTKETREKIRESGRSVPAWLSISNDMIIIGFLAGFGMFPSAGAVLFGMVVEYNLYDGE